MPYHIPDCKRTNGRGFLACGFSQSHYFRTKDELAHHEAIYRMRRQFEGAAPLLVSAASFDNTLLSVCVVKICSVCSASYQSGMLTRELGVSPMQKFAFECAGNSAAEANAASLLLLKEF
ncbi:hypothetical protein BV898_04052 [Hypsibius exemplaris]|uniref:Uncharacterized protein n=1 Tax=Hypsibius exemplaris TaxID=2072580 RepID=A0A1W0X3Z3_HYPEX|nr:hypothetical protein BV898_04052 [Hypsibius exemplaris]